MDFEKFTRLGPKKAKGRVCSVPNCDSIDDGTVTFHQFPKSGKKIVLKNPDGTINYCDRRKVWIDRVGIDQQITYLSKVCSIHFNPEDFGKSGTKHRRLRATAIPVLNLPDERGAFSGFKNITEALYEYRPVDSNHNIKRKNIQESRGVVNSAPKLCDSSSNIKDIASATLKVIAEMPPCTTETKKDELAQGVVDSAPELCDNSTNIEDITSETIKVKAEMPPSAIKTEKDESCDTKYSIKHLSEIPPFSPIKIEKREKNEFVMKSAINNNQILDMLLMHTSFEMEYLTSSGNLSATDYNSSPNCT